MADSSSKSCSKQVQPASDQPDAKGLPFRMLLPQEKIDFALKQAGIMYRKDRVYTPPVTLWAFLSQVLSQDGACQAAVARVLAHRVEQGQKPCSTNTSSYCDARQELSQAVILKLALEAAREAHEQALQQWKWKGREVQIVDGSTVTMADTPENQEAYPQSRSQKPGLGFPILRFVVLLSLSTGAVLQCATGPCRGKKTGELNLFRQVQASLTPGTILLGDRYYDSYQDIAHLRSQGVDVVFGMKNLRKFDFRRGRRLGPNDHVVVWTRPKYDSSRFNSRDEWTALPETMEMRECRLRVTRPGYRPRVIIVVTTLLDGETYSKAELMQLFAQRWNCELDLRSIKRSLGMSHLRCKTPEMVEKELWVYLLAYNLIRSRMSQAAATHGILPRELSFQSAKTFIREFLSAQHRANLANADHLEQVLLGAIAGCRVGDRPGRKEPRAVKKREQKYPKLKLTRAQARKGLPA